MKQEEKEFIHLQFCLNDLSEALLILEELKTSDSSILKVAAFRYSLIAYSRPYKKSRGPSGNYILSKKYIPPECIALHERILASRDQIQAHTDLSIRDVKLHISQINDVKLPLIASNLIHGHEELANIDDIIMMIKKTLDSLILAIQSVQNKL